MTWSVSPECRRRSKHTEIAPERSSFTTMLRHGLLSDKVYRICNGSFNILSLVLALRTNLINSPAPARLRPLTLSSMKILKARDFSLYDLAFSLSTPDRKYVSSATPFARSTTERRSWVSRMRANKESLVYSRCVVRIRSVSHLAVTGPAVVHVDPQVAHYNTTRSTWSSIALDS